jgi:hypothetical protein
MGVETGEGARGVKWFLGHEEREAECCATGCRSRVEQGEESCQHISTVFFPFQTSIVAILRGGSKGC